MLSRFDGVKRCNDNQYMARCPCHDDRKQSLSIGKGEKGIILKCHAGCDTRDIIARVDLKPSDLFYEQRQKERPQIEAVYTYPSGAQKIRYSKKDFRWRRPNGKGGWIWSRKGIPHSLYIAGELTGTVFLCEGEKDADNLHKLGYEAASGEDGAGKGKWRKEYTKQLQGCAVCIFQDHDEVGRAYAQETAAALHGVASSVQVFDLSTVWPEIPEHGDVSDLIARMGTGKACELIANLIDTTPQWTPEKETQRERKRSGPPPEGTQVNIDVIDNVLQWLGIGLRYNQLLKEMEVSGLPDCYSQENAASVLPVYLMDVLKACECKGVTRTRIEDCLSCIADRNRYNPIHVYLNSGRWDGTDRFPEVYRILGITESRYKTYIRKWFLQCVALGLNELGKEVKADGVLVLQGRQGIAKTSFFRIMTPFPRWFVEGAVVDVGNKDTIITALSGWICELGELDGILKKEQSSLKAFITLPEDRIRIPYGRSDTRAPRRTSFCGTVNPQDFLKDETGSRRFWTVPVENVDKKALFSLSRDFVAQVWFQVYETYKGNPDGFRLTDAEMEALQSDNRDFDVPLPYELEIRELLDYSLPVEEWEWWKTGDISKRLYGIVDAARVGRALKRICCEGEVVQKIGEVRGGKGEVKAWRKNNGVPQYFLPLRHFPHEQGR